MESARSPSLQRALRSRTTGIGSRGQRPKSFAVARRGNLGELRSPASCTIPPPRHMSFAPPSPLRVIDMLGACLSPVDRVSDGEVLQIADCRDTCGAVQSSNRHVVLSSRPVHLPRVNPAREAATQPHSIGEFALAQPSLSTGGADRSLSSIGSATGRNERGNYASRSIDSPNPQDQVLRVETIHLARGCIRQLDTTLVLDPDATLAIPDLGHA